MRARLLSSLLLVASLSAQAQQQLVLSPSNVIGWSSFISGFLPGDILDQQIGSVTDVSRSTYWLNPDGSAAGTTYLTIDLGSAVQLDHFDLFNTKNPPWGDRGTGSFRIVAGNAITPTSANNFRLSGDTLVLVTGALPAVPLNASPTANSFSVASGATFRYLSFEPLSTASPNPPTSTSAFGLNEMRVFVAEVPEPATLLTFSLGVGVVGIAFHRRRRPH